MLKEEMYQLKWESNVNQQKLLQILVIENKGHQSTKHIKINIMWYSFPKDIDPLYTHTHIGKNVKTKFGSEGS